MNIPSKDEQILTHILRHCHKVEKTINRVEREFDVFVQDADFIDSVCLNIMQIGELAGSLSKEYTNSTKDLIPWKAIIGMRNIIAHHYGTIDVERMWNTALCDIPVLQDFCEKQLQEFEETQTEQMGFSGPIF